MNREIRFRAWDGQQMHENITLSGEFFHGYELTTKGLNECGTVDAYTDSWPFRGMPLMQYTGLQDKNGTEIYEGDIIIDRHDAGEGRIHEVIKVVEWEELPVGFGIGFSLNPEHELEVIGDVYCNPELLEQAA